MAATLQSVTVTQDAASGLLALTIGGVVHEMPAAAVFAILERGVGLEALIFQIVQAMRQNNFNPRAATRAQLKSFIESRQFWWGA